MSFPRTLILFGYGSRVSSGIATKFLSEGYNVAVVSRKPHPELAGVEKLTHIVANLDDPSTVDKVFADATSKYGPVSTVVYNAYPWIDLPTPNSPFSIPLDQLTFSQNVGLFSAYRAAQLLLESKFGGPKHFLYTGNLLHVAGHAWPAGFALGLSKASASHFLEVGAKSYGRDGRAFFYNVWESNLDGTSTGNNVDPEGHGQVFFELAQTKEQAKWDVSFVVEDGKAKRASKDLVFKSDW